MKSAAVALACLIPCMASAAPPAPRITVHASGIKQLRFEWEPVAGASRYELWFRASDAAPWVEYTEKPAPRSSIAASVAVHLLEWPQARYQLKACDTSGCSTSNTVRVNHDEKLVAMGYFKPNVPSGRHYGGVVQLSADGNTMAVLGEETVGSVPSSVVVYVYRNSGTGWQYEAKLRPSRIQTGTAATYIGDPVAISGDGNLVALGVAFESADPQTEDETGAVYLFRRTGSTWRLAQRKTRNESSDLYGYAVRLDDAGRTLAVTHLSYQNYERNKVEMYRDPEGDGSDQFVHDATIPVPFIGGVQAQCEAIQLSGDGQTLLRGCVAFTPTENGFVQMLRAPDWADVGRLYGGDRGGYDISYDGSVILVQDYQYARVFRKTGDTWVREGELGTFGGHLPAGHRGVALSRDGKIAALGSISDVAAGLGPVFPPYSTGDTETGAVIVHERRSTGWVLRRLVKPGNTQMQWAGHSVALGDNGRVLAVGAMFENSAASGINGDREDASAPERGAVWLY